MLEKRYNVENTIADADLSFISANLARLKELSTSVYVVPPSQVHRMDLISNAIYGMVGMKVYLMYVNDIIDLSVVEFGYSLRYPTIRDILSVINETKNFK